MPKNFDNETFKQTLSALSLAQQRQVGARFIANVLDLTDETSLKDAQGIAGKPGVTAEELLEAYHSVHAVYVATDPRSDLSALDYERQAAHFVAEACLSCLAPSYQEVRIHHLAEKVAMYCLMARTSATIHPEEQFPPLVDAEGALKKEPQPQYRILSEFLESL